MSKNGVPFYSYLGKENRSLFLNETFQGGESLFYHGGVKITYKEESDYKQEVHANVKGEDGDTYAVRLDLSNHLIKKADCNCLYARSGLCKHIAATLVALGKEEEEQKGDASFYRSLNLLFSRNSDSISSLLDKSFALITRKIDASGMSEEAISEAVLFIYKNLRSLIRFNVNLVGKDALERISNLPLGESERKSLYERLFSLFYEDAAKSFFLTALDDEKFKTIALNTFFSALAKKDYRYFSFYFTKKEKASFLSSLSEADLKRLATLPFSLLFSPKDLLEEMKRRNDSSLYSSFLSNRYESYEASFNLELGKLLKDNRNQDYLSAYKNVLASRGLSLIEFVSFYHTLEEKERLIFLPMLETQAYYRGFEGAYRFLKSKDESLLKKFTLKEWAALASDISSSHLVYDSYLRRKIETALASKSGAPDLLETMENIMGNYPLSITRSYLNDPRLINMFKSSGAFAHYLKLLEKTGTLEELHYLGYKE